MRCISLTQNSMLIFVAMTFAAIAVSVTLRPTMAQESSQESASTGSQNSQAKEIPTEDSSRDAENDAGWKPLLPKAGLDGWKVTDFGTSGRVSRDGELLIVEKGDPLNGITYTKKDYPTDNFEISLEVKRIEGRDFMCGLTFPVDKEFCSFIAGGWGGGLIGLSSVDGFDASENGTTNYREFEDNKWYQFRVRVDQEYIRAWLGDRELFRQEREHHEFSTRIEVYSSQPLGFCTFLTKVAVRNFRWRPIGESNESDSTENGQQADPGTATSPSQSEDTSR